MVGPKFEIEYRDQKVTAWGGMRLMKEVLRLSILKLTPMRRVRDVPMAIPSGDLLHVKILFDSPTHNSLKDLKHKQFLCILKIGYSKRVL